LFITRHEPAVGQATPIELHAVDGYGNPITDILLQSLGFVLTPISDTDGAPYGTATILGPNATSQSLVLQGIYRCEL
jgi:hypothetical protein